MDTQIVAVFCLCDDMLKALYQRSGKWVLQHKPPLQKGKAAKRLGGYLRPSSDKQIVGKLNTYGGLQPATSRKFTFNVSKIL